jgi:hypothetical protein
MRERRIFLNITHVPRIWGVPYPKVFTTVGLLVFSTVVGNALSGGSGTAVKMLVVLAAVVLSGSLHVFFILMERVDVLEQELPFVKDQLNSQNSSLQTVRLLPNAPYSKGKKKR